LDKNKLLEKKGEITDETIMDEITKALQIQIGFHEEYN
jgi:hypothetical protein